MKFPACIFLTLIAFPSAACPFCNSRTATQIRASLFGPDFFFNIFVTLLPFAIFSIIIILIYKGGFQKRSINK